MAYFVGRSRLALLVLAYRRSHVHMVLPFPSPSSPSRTRNVCPFCGHRHKIGSNGGRSQAPEFVAVFGPDGYPLTSERMQREMDVYAEWKALLGDELTSRYLPEIYYFDSTFGMR